MQFIVGINAFGEAQPQIWALSYTVKWTRLALLYSKELSCLPKPRFSPDQELFIMEEKQSNILRSFSVLHSIMRVNACNDL